MSSPGIPPASGRDPTPGKGADSHSSESRPPDLDGLAREPGFLLTLNEARLAHRYLERSQDHGVTVILPTWNRSFILRRAIDSVLAQSYRHFELVLIDDGSTDGTREVINAEYSADSRLRYIETDHRGVSHARNVGLAHATGEIVAYLDSDNEWSEHYLLIMVNTLLDHPSLPTAYCGIRVVNNIQGKSFVRLYPYDRRTLLAGNYIDMNIFVHRKSAFERLGGFREDLRCMEDWELILRYTRDHEPCVVECVLATYYLEKEFGHLTQTENFMEHYRQVRQLHAE